MMKLGSNIKFILLVLTTTNVVRSDEFHNEWEKSGATWYDRWTEMERRSVNMTDKKIVNGFSGILGAPVESLSDKEKDLYNRIKTMLLNTPGHAEYFGKQIEEMPRHHLRHKWFYVLEKLPSPETVSVLGKLLSDNRGRPALAKDDSNIEEYVNANPNCDEAARTLQSILANPPVPKQEYFNFERDLGVWRSWWENVKSGKQAFSFEGQNVEYRFKPDGTWTEGPLGSTKRSDRATHSINGGLRSAKQGVSTEETEGADRDARKQPGRMQWLLAGLIVLLGIGFYIFKIRRRLL